MNNNQDFENLIEAEEIYVWQCDCKEVMKIEDFECAGDEVLVESSPPASPDMATRLAQPAQSTASGGGSSPGAESTAASVRELIVIPELPNSIQLHHAIHQVSSSVVEVNGDSSGHSSPNNTDGQHTFITVAMEGAWNKGSLKSEPSSDQESEGSNGVNYHVQYVTEPQEIYAQGHQMEALRSYPVYGVATVSGGVAEPAPDSGWGGASNAEYTAYGLVVAGDEAEAPASPATPGCAPPPRMPPATVQWLLDHYETAEGVSLPRSTLYAHYLRHCSAHRLEPVNAASFGKLIRSVFVGLRTRRLGTRGNSKYHYYGIRAKPTNQDHEDSADDKSDGHDKQEEEEGGAGSRGSPTSAASPLSAAAAAHRQYLGAVSAPDPPELSLALAADHADSLRTHHREYGVQFLEAVAALDTGGVEASRRAFWLASAVCWRAAPPAQYRWLRAADTRLYQRGVELLLPDVLRAVSPHLTMAIRNFAKSVEAAISAGSATAPAAGIRAGSAAAAALAAALRRYTSLNHLAQAARAVLTNHNQIQQMVSDLNRVDFRVVREQAAWACGCSSQANALKLEADFKATLSRGASLEAWAAWLDGCVRSALARGSRRGGAIQRARRLLLHWSFYSSLVIRELTLRSAASFGSFHLLRLLYDEYVSFLVERRVAALLAAPPIAVMHLNTNEDEEEEAPEDNPRQEADEEDPEWEWDDDEEEDDEPTSPDNKKPKLD